MSDRKTPAPRERGRDRDGTPSPAAGRRRPATSPRVLAAAALATVALLVAAYYLGVRDSGFFAVRQVEITGIGRYTLPGVRDALELEARQMTTLHVDRQRLHDAVAEYAVVERIETDVDLPHGLRIVVYERRAVAGSTSAGSAMLLTADGYVLRGGARIRRLPRLDVPGLIAGSRVHDAKLLRVLRVLGAAPDPMLTRVARIAWGKKGLALVMRAGPRLIFGSSRDPALKWRAAAAVLADRATAGASYVDLRVPTRPVVGGLGPAPTTGRPEPEVPPPSTTTRPGPTPATRPATGPTGPSM